MAVGVWRKATSKLFDLEAKIANQVGVLTRHPTQRHYFHDAKHLCTSCNVCLGGWILHLAWVGAPSELFNIYLISSGLKQATTRLGLHLYMNEYI